MVFIYALIFKSGLTSAIAIFDLTVATRVFLNRSKSFWCRNFNYSCLETILILLRLVLIVRDKRKHQNEYRQLSGN